MKIALIFISPNGNTRKIADILSEKMLFENEIVKIDLGSLAYRNNFEKVNDLIKSVDIIGIGSPIYHMDILKPLKNFLNKTTFDKKAFLFYSYAGITSGKAFINTYKILKLKNIDVVGGIRLYGPHFFHNKEFPNNELYEIIERFVNEIQKRKFTSFDGKQVKKAFRAIKKRVNFIYPLVHIIGKKRELPIEFNRNKCIKCGKCFRECPAGAIDKEKIEINFDKCLHCYHCYSICPVDAIKTPIHKMDGMIEKNIKIIGKENNPNRILL